jgi:hypothetical protein
MYPSSIHLKQKMQEKKLHHIHVLNSLFLAQIEVKFGIPTRPIEVANQGCRRRTEGTNGAR